MANKVYMIKSPTCGPCKILAPIFEELGERHSAEFIISDASVDPDIANKYRVKGFPTFVAVDSSGAVLSTIAGGMTKAQLIKWLEESGV